MADEWGSAIVVRSASPRGGGGPHTGTVQVSSAPQSQVVATHGGAPGAADVASPLIPCDRHSMLPPPTMAESLIGRDIADTFWKPDVVRGERSLLEALHLRTTANRTYLLISTRPEAELTRNFSTPDGKLFSLNHDMFKISKTAQAFGQLNQIDDTAHLSGQDLKQGLRNNLPTLQQNDYYLVRYRDYSPFAVKQYAGECKNDSYFGAKYVERCFAVRVGQSSGVLIPISEAQLIFGWEILQKQKLDMVPTLAQNSFTLTADQFSSLGVIQDEEELVDNVARGINAAIPEAADGNYVPPSPWDWTPGAIQKRWNHYLEQKYKTVGRFVVQAVVVGGLLYIAMSYASSFFGGSGNQQGGRGGGRGSRGGGRIPRSSRRAEYSDDPRGALPSLVSSLNPKYIFDAILAPAGSRGDY